MSKLIQKYSSYRAISKTIRRNLFFQRRICVSLSFPCCYCHAILANKKCCYQPEAIFSLWKFYDFSFTGYPLTPKTLTPIATTTTYLFCAWDQVEAFASFHMNNSLSYGTDVSAFTERLPWSSHSPIFNHPLLIFQSILSEKLP